MLPEDERAQVLDDIQKVSKERRRGRRPRSQARGRPTTQLYRQRPEYEAQPVGVESAATTTLIDDHAQTEWCNGTTTVKSLLGSSYSKDVYTK